MSMKDRRQKHNPHRGEVIEFKPKNHRIQLLVVERRIFRDWLRGLAMRALAREYRVPVAEVEEIVREQVSGQVAA